MSRKGAIKAILSIILTAFLLYIFFRGTDISAFWRYLKEADPLYLLGFALGLIFFYWIRALRWKLLYDAPPSAGIFFLANVMGFSVNYLFPGRVGEIARAVYVAKKGNISSSYSFATVVVERFFDFFTIGLMIFFYLLAVPVKASRLRGNLVTIVIVSIVAIGILIIGIVFLTHLVKKGKTSFLRPILKIFPEKTREKIRKGGLSFVEGLHFFSSPKRAILFFLFGFLVWLEVAFQYWLGLKAFGISRNFFQIIPFIGVLLVGVSIPTPGMAGGFEVASRFFIVDIWKYPVSKAVAATITLHAILLIVTLGMGIFVGLKEGLKMGKEENL